MHHRIALSFLSALAPRCNGNVRLGPWYVLMSQLYLCSTRAERHLKLSHSHLKPSTKSLKKPKSWGNPCWGSFESGSCSSSVGPPVWVAAVALWPLILGHVPRNQLELRTCIPRCCGDDYQGCRKLQRWFQNVVPALCNFEKSDCFFRLLIRLAKQRRQADGESGDQHSYHHSLNMKRSQGTQLLFLCSWKLYLSLNLSSLPKSVSTLIPSMIVIWIMCGLLSKEAFWCALKARHICRSTCRYDGAEDADRWQVWWWEGGVQR